MNYKLDAAIAGLRALSTSLQVPEGDGGLPAIADALEKLAEGLEQEFRDLHREDERLKERIKNNKA